MDLVAKDKSLLGLSSINVILGRNGAGKSRLLRHLDTFCRENGSQFGSVKYVTPERGGEWKLNPSVELNLRNSAGWADAMRSRNRYEQYREMVMSEFAALELGFFRRAEADKKAGRAPNVDFDSVLKKINALLDHVQIVRPDEGQAKDQPFPVVPKDGGKYGDNFISSGEAELVALGCEIVSFSHRTGSGQLVGKENILLVDEPDVHLHPDLQYRLIALLTGEVRSNKFRVILATHSTAIVAALSEFSDARVAFMTSGLSSLTFQPISSVVKSILPIFGAHPLSNVFNESPPLLVEGDDDVRIWQQAIRTSQNELKFWPCAVDGKGNFPVYEKAVEAIASAIYDAPRAFSLRDKDGSESSELIDTPVVSRLRLNCRAAENLLLADEILLQHGTNWEKFKLKVGKWIETELNADHPQIGQMKKFKASGFDRQNFDLKDIRYILLELLGPTKPWEVIIGQAIAGLKIDASTNHTLSTYLGKKVIETLGLGLGKGEEPERSSRLKVEVMVQVSGKKRDILVIDRGASIDDVKSAALALDSVKSVLAGRQPKQVIVVPHRIVNVVI